MGILYGDLEKMVTTELGNNAAFTDVLRRSDTLDPLAIQDLKANIEQLVRSYLGANQDNAPALTKNIYDQNYGFGAITALQEDHTVSEIWVNSPDNIWFERDGIRTQYTDAAFRDNDDLRRVAELMCRYSKKEISVSSPIVECRLADGSRVTITSPPITESYSFSLRLPNAFVPSTENMLKSGTIDNQVIDILHVLVRGRANIIIIGETGAGKTQFLRWLVGMMRKDLRIVSIEQNKELLLNALYPYMNIQEMEESLEHGIGLDKLFHTSLHMSPDIILYGEMRSSEASWVINAMRRAHVGSISTLHTGAPEFLVNDVSEMICEDGRTRDSNFLTQRIANAVDIVIQVHRFNNSGKRRVTRISEISKDGATFDKPYQINDLCVYDEDIDAFKRVGQLRTKHLAQRFLQYATGGEDPIPSEKIKKMFHGS